MQRAKRIIKRALFLFVGAALLSFLACSPGYVLRAGWEEAGILARRHSIRGLIDDPEIDAETKRKLKLVLEARDFAAELGLKPGGSFTKYTKVDRDVLVWVLSGADKISLQPVTWWFPIVGSIPYKGFFEKEDALAAGDELKQKGFDIYVRGSAAFSTLGWFNDPLLSTTLRYEDLDLVNTVIHEILHNTVWVPSQVPFNETLANFVGSRGVGEFFRMKIGPDAPLTAEAENSWADQLVYAHFLDSTMLKLKAVYDEGKKALEAAPKEDHERLRAEILNRREAVFLAVKEEWAAIEPSLKTKRFRGAAEKLNNAVLLAQLAYFQTPWDFEDLYEVCGKSLLKTIEVVKTLPDIPGFKQEPFRILREKVKLLREADGLRQNAAAER